MDRKTLIKVKNNTVARTNSPLATHHSRAGGAERRLPRWAAIPLLFIAAAGFAQQRPLQSLYMFDPLLVKAFISMTGYYPVGSVVILDSYELGVVVASSTKPDRPHQPVVRVIYDDLGLPVEPARTLDLTEVDAATGAPIRTIIKTTDPEQYGINVRDYFA